MTHVLSLITHPETPILDDALMRRLSEHLDISSRVVLANAVAVDFQISSNFDVSGLKSRLAPLPIDINIVQVEGRRKKLLIADMDSTIIEQECIDELAAHIGKYDEIARITELAMRGELNFEQALTERVGKLKGLPSSVIDETWEKRISFTSGASTLLSTMKKTAATTALVSGGFTQFTYKVAKALGFDFQSANELILADSCLTGEVLQPILGRGAKADTLQELCKDHNIALRDCLAVGDGANDLDMIGIAGMGVAFRAKPATAQAAQYQIDHGDLTALLYLQGIPQTEHVRSEL